MSSATSRLNDPLKRLAVLLLAAAALEGCNRMPSEEQSVDRFFEANPRIKRVPVAKFAGRVSVDGQLPAQGTRLYVILSDSEHLEKPSTNPPKCATFCDADGKFEFTTYLTGDGVPYGKYVVTFAELHLQRGRGRTSVGATRSLQEYIGPDELKNLYNDPEKNKNDRAFLVDVEPPGRTDYEFNLSVAGKEPVLTPGEYAVTTMR
jgi:hypothetical protein